MSKTVSEVLFAAADLIEPEGAWTQGCSARDAQGNQTSATRKQAVCWCAAGAIWHEVGDHSSFTADAATDELEQTLGGMIPVGTWNDAPDRTQAEVVAKLREAAEKAREQGL